MTAAVEINDVTFTWRGRTSFSLAIPELSVTAGEKLFLLGESGSGKSTLLSLICGINTPDRGMISIGGVSLSDLRPAARDKFRAEHIGVIFQMFNLLPYASPLENILLPLSFAPARRAQVDVPKDEAMRLATALGLPEEMVTQANTTELSIGQQQRVAAARALIGKPKLIIADEPTSSLDASTQEAFIKLLMTQTEDAGATLIMVSHDQRLSAQFDRSLDLAHVSRITRGTP
ncbi:ABC transporter ATP-binding protein [Shimia sp. Alg240-R146]|uniref:ABC transporter ATP-binding protein n=1 Tax=Shimia sp. Alg240-R146 TaxID=2993449 RepID=UPI0022E477D2|nr:ABC transporter ATP-binding protein [Shimia sp. Alg240-R146]